MYFFLYKYITLWYNIQVDNSCGPPLVKVMGGGVAGPHWGADPLLSGHSLLNINFIKILENEYKIHTKNLQFLEIIFS